MGKVLIAYEKDCGFNLHEDPVTLVHGHATVNPIMDTPDSIGLGHRGVLAACHGDEVPDDIQFATSLTVGERAMAEAALAAVEAATWTNWGARTDLVPEGPNPSASGSSADTGTTSIYTSRYGGSSGRSQTLAGVH